MAKRNGKYTVELTNGVVISCSAGVAGKKEKEGPLGEYFDKTFNDDRMGASSWEKAESALQTAAVNELLIKARLTPADIDIMFAGDLLAQCIASSFGLRDFGIQLYGQYGACSTMAQTLSAAAVFIDSGAAERALAVTSSHFCSAERQFRMPVEYGGQRTMDGYGSRCGAAYKRRQGSCCKKGNSRQDEGHEDKRRLQYGSCNGSCGRRYSDTIFQRYRNNTGGV